MNSYFSYTSSQNQPKDQLRLFSLPLDLSYPSFLVYFTSIHVLSWDLKTRTFQTPKSQFLKYVPCKYLRENLRLPYTCFLLSPRGARLTHPPVSFLRMALTCCSPGSVDFTKCLSLYRDQRPILGRKIKATMNNKVICRNLFCFLFIANGNREEKLKEMAP